MLVLPVCRSASLWTATLHPSQPATLLSTCWTVCMTTGNCFVGRACGSITTSTAVATVSSCAAHNPVHAVHPISRRFVFVINAITGLVPRYSSRCQQCVRSGQSIVKSVPTADNCCCSEALSYQELYNIHICRCMPMRRSTPTVATATQQLADCLRLHFPTLIILQVANVVLLCVVCCCCCCCCRS